MTTTTTTSIDSPNYMDCTEPINSPSRFERTKSFLKASIIKKWKSSKELFTKPISNLTESDKNIKRKQIETQPQNGKFINEKVLENLDEFERNFLLSAGRKILVRELRKNFEKPQYAQTIQLETPNWFANGNPKQFVNASVQTTPNYEDFHFENKTVETATSQQNQKKNPMVTRHSSFYNTYRNEYYAWQNNHYASNLSLISYGVPRNSEKCLEKAINKYKNSIKSSSAVDLSSISSEVLNSTNSTISKSMEKSSSNLKHHHSSIVSHSNFSKNLTDSQIIECNYVSIAPIVDERIQNNQLKITCSINSLNPNYSTTVRDGIYNTNMNTHFETQIDYTDRNSLITTSTLPAICGNRQNIDSTTCHFHTYVSKSNLTLAETNVNNIQNNNNNNNDNNYEFSSPLIRKCHSINQINLNLLKNELDEYIVREIRTTNFGRNTLAQRRCLFENKVNIIRQLEFEFQFPD